MDAFDTGIFNSGHVLAIQDLTAMHAADLHRKKSLIKLLTNIVKIETALDDSDISASNDNSTEELDQSSSYSDEIWQQSADEWLDDSPQSFINTHAGKLP